MLGRGRIPYIPQLELTDCGAAALAMALSANGADFNLTEVRNIARGTRDGVTALDIVRAAQQLGHEAAGVRAELDGVAGLPAGTILHWGFNHFVVLEAPTRKGGIRIIDPAAGRRTVSAEEVSRRFTGVAVVVSADHAGRGRGSPQRILPLLRPHVRLLMTKRSLWVHAMLLSGALQAFAFATPFLVRSIIDRGVRAGDSLTLYAGAVGCVVLVLSQVALQFIRSRLLLHLQLHFMDEARGKFMTRLLNLPMTFFLSRSTGDLLMRVNSSDFIQQVVTSQAVTACLDALLAVGYLFAMWLLEPLLCAVAACVAAAQLVLLLAARGKVRDLAGIELEASSRVQRYQTQLLSGIESVKVAGAEESSLKEWSRLLDAFRLARLERGQAASGLEALQEGLRLGAPLVVLLVGAYQAASGRITLGTLLAANGLILAFLRPLASVMAVGFMLQTLSGHLVRTNDILEANVEPSGNVKLDRRVAGVHVRADTVTYRHSSRARPAVSAVSLEIPANGLVAVVGETGSGKSTLAALLGGQLLPTEGRILLDGADSRELDRTSRCAAVGVVNQQTYIFEGTVKQNLRLRNPSAGAGVLRAACVLAEIQADIESMPMGIDTVLAAGGTTLSGGQRQRLALARAMVRRPRLLILDEATSQVDKPTEARILRNLRGVPCTVVWVTHRLEAMAGADLILVMKGGSLVEAGTFQQLVDARGEYARLLGRQRAEVPS